MLMRYDDEGDGAAVVLLHSGVCDRRMWEVQAAALATSHRVVRPDFRGFGETPLPSESFGFDSDVVALLDALHIDQATFVGSSIGGRVALEVATQRPDRVTSLILLCPAFEGLDPTFAAQEFEEREAALIESGESDAAVDLNLAAWLGPDASVETRAMVRRMQRHSFDVQLAAEAAGDLPDVQPVAVDPTLITAPTLVVSGDRDMDHFRNIARHLAGTIPDAELCTLPWAAHLPSLERPAEVTELLVRTLGDKPSTLDCQS